jgi:hypothetical protein
MAETIIRFASSKEHYTAEACIFWCYDARFADLYEEFLAQRGFSRSRIDLVKGAGGAQPLAGDAGADRDIARSQLAKSIALHHTERAILMVHMDCGGYGGSKAFHGDWRAEQGHHAAELRKAAAFVRAEFPEIREVECWVADFDGVRRIEGEPDAIRQ